MKPNYHDHPFQDLGFFKEEVKALKVPFIVPYIYLCWMYNYHCSSKTNLYPPFLHSCKNSLKKRTNLNLKKMYIYMQIELISIQWPYLTQAT